MAFPSNPSNGDTTTQFGRVYSYDATLDAWLLVSANSEVYFTANSAFETANSAGDYANSSFITANAAFDAANNAVDTWVRDAANSASDYANSAFEAANNAVDTWVRDAANSASDYANSGFTTANAAQTHAEAAYTAANSTTGVTYTINTSPPASGNTIGDIWIDSNDGILYTWLDDGDSYQWIELGPTPGAISSSGGSGGSDPSVVYTYSILFGA